MSNRVTNNYSHISFQCLCVETSHQQLYRHYFPMSLCRSGSPTIVQTLPSNVSVSNQVTKNYTDITFQCLCVEPSHQELYRHYLQMSLCRTESPTIIQTLPSNVSESNRVSNNYTDIFFRCLCVEPNHQQLYRHFLPMSLCRTESPTIIDTLSSNVSVWNRG